MSVPSVYISDLDGTLLGPDAKLSAFSRRHLERMLGRGLSFTVASARSVVSIRGALGPLPLALPVICFNGGFVSDLATGRHHHVFSLPGEVAAAVADRARARGLHPIVSTTDGVSEDRVYIPTERNAGTQMYLDDRRAAADPRVRVVPVPLVRADQRVTCLTVIDRRAELEPLAAELDALLGARIQPHLFDDMYTPGWAWLTVHGGEATKAHAANLVMEAHGLAGHRLVAFGDQDNDLPLLRVADHAVVPRNAAPSVLAVADEVIGDHADDSVVRWLLQHAS